MVSLVGFGMSGNLRFFPNTSAETITKSLLDCLGEHGFDKIFLNKCFIAFACDGSSVMIGKDSGVAT